MGIPFTPSQEITLMAWPLSQDYNEVIQDPPSCFGDPGLREGQPATNALGIPMPCSGNFADVYQINCPSTGRTWAAKCGPRWTFSQSDRRFFQGRSSFVMLGSKK
jgi:hypothetical protein